MPFIDTYYYSYYCSGVNQVKFDPFYTWPPEACIHRSKLDRIYTWRPEACCFYYYN